MNDSFFSFSQIYRLCYCWLHCIAATGDCFAICELLGFATIFVYLNNEIINETNQTRIIIICDLIWQHWPNVYSLPFFLLLIRYSRVSNFPTHQSHPHFAGVTRILGLSPAHPRKVINRPHFPNFLGSTYTFIQTICISSKSAGHNTKLFHCDSHRNLTDSIIIKLCTLCSIQY